MKRISSYLAHLKFDPKLLTTWHARYLKTIRIVILLVLTILVLGITSFVTLPRRLNPEVKIPIVTITTLLPGAGPNDIESLVTQPLENVVAGLTGINTVSSVSQNNVSIITLEFTSTTRQDKALSDTQAAVNSLTTLPKDVKTPSVRALDFEDQPIWRFALSTDYDRASLMRFGLSLREKIKDLHRVDRVQVGGLETQDILIFINPEKIQQYSFDTFSVTKTIQSTLASYPAGNVHTNGANFALTIDKGITSIEDIRNLTLSLNNQVVKLSDIATIKYANITDQPKTYFATPILHGEAALSFSVFKTKSADITAVIDQVQKLVDHEVERTHNIFKVSSIVNTGEEIQRQFGDLVSEFRSTIILVFFTQLFFLGLRQAFIVSFTIPLTFLVTFAVMQAMGITINFLSLFSLLLSLGLLVDDAIVIVSAMTAYYRTGKFTPYQTGLLVWKDFIVPIWTTTITTVWAFIPLLLSTGIIGEFIKTIPIVVSTAMYTSTTIAVLITLPLMITILKSSPPRRVTMLVRIILVAVLIALFIIPQRLNPLLPFIIVNFIIFLAITYTIRRQLIKTVTLKTRRFVDTKRVVQWIKAKADGGIINTSLIRNRYHRIIDSILDSKTNRRTVLIIVVLYTLFSYLLVPLGLVVNEFFPKSDQKTLYVTAELPAGSTLTQVDSFTKEYLEHIRKTKDSSFVVAEVGRGAMVNFSASPDNSNVSLFTLVLPERKLRTHSSIEIADILRSEESKETKAKVSVVELSGGPPAGADVVIKLRGDDLKILDQYADKITAFLKTEPGLTNVEKSIKVGVGKLVFVPDETLLGVHGVTRDMLGLLLRTFASGLKIDTVTIDDINHDIVLATNESSQFVEAIGNVTVPTRDGPLPLLSLGKIILETNPTVITREDGKRTISVNASVVSGFSLTKANKSLEEYANTKLNLPAGYEWKTGGVNEENQKSVQSIFQAMILATILIMGTMVIQFNSYRKALIVLLVIPIAVSSVFLIFALTGTPLSFPALIGVLALFGIVVTNSMVIVEKINQNLRFGMDLKSAISDAAASRVEPIMFTSTTTIMGLIPITLSNPLWRGLGGAIVSGLLFSGIIMLFFIPVVYYQWYAPQRKTPRS